MDQYNYNTKLSLHARALNASPTTPETSNEHPRHPGRPDRGSRAGCRTWSLDAPSDGLALGALGAAADLLLDELRVPPVHPAQLEPIDRRANALGGVCERTRASPLCAKA